MSLWVRRKMAMQFLYAMNFLHKHDVCHRDLSYGNVLNDIYSIGFILNYIFTGRRDLLADGSRLGFIIQKCSTTNSADRYQTVKGIIEDMRKTECPVG